ncbi:MAG: ABC transporter permease subunit [Polyangiales bacterium]|jgi:ABC-type transport system involved in multi-copper enzyme maturation permease subunit
MKSAARIYAIALNTYREAVRDRILLGVLVLAGGVLALTLALAELSLDQQMRVVTDLGLASISLFSVVVAIFLGSSLLYKEIERKTLYVILPKPIARFEFLLGKYFGIVATCAVFIAIMGGVQLLVTAIQAGASTMLVVAAPGALLLSLAVGFLVSRDRTLVLPIWSLLALGVSAWVCSTVDVELSPLLSSFVLNLGEVLILSAIALLFSSFSTPFLTGAFTFGVWLVGRASHDMVAMKTRVLSPSMKRLLSWLAEVVPNLDLFVPGRNTLVNDATGFGAPLTYITTTMAYAILYAGVTLFIAALIFRRRDFL